MIADRGMQNRRRTRHSGRGLRLRLRASVPLALLFLLSLSPAARADSCPITDPGCLTETVEKTADDAQKTLTAIVDEGKETVEETERSVGETTDQVVGLVEGTVDVLLGSPGDDDGETDPGGRTQKEGGTKKRKKKDKVEPAPSASVSEDRLLRLLGPSRPVSLVRPVEGGSAGTGPTGPGGAIGAAARLAFPLVLALVVAAFLAVQNRMDRSDPKLTLAPERPDYLAFQ